MSRTRDRLGEIKIVLDRLTETTKKQALISSLVWAVEEIESLRERLRVSHGGCRILSEGDNCDCGLCNRDEEIAELKEKLDYSVNENKKEADMKQVIAREFMVTRDDVTGTTRRLAEGEKYVYFEDTATGKLYRPVEGFIVTGDDLSDRFVEVKRG